MSVLGWATFVKSLRWVGLVVGGEAFLKLILYRFTRTFLCFRRGVMQLSLVFGVWNCVVGKSWVSSYLFAFVKL